MRLCTCLLMYVPAYVRACLCTCLQPTSRAIPRAERSPTAFIFNRLLWSVDVSCTNDFSTQRCIVDPAREVHGFVHNLPELSWVLLRQSRECSARTERVNPVLDGRLLVLCLDLTVCSRCCRLLVHHYPLIGRIISMSATCGQWLSLCSCMSVSDLSFPMSQKE